MPSISVVIPVLNESAKIDRCLQGILQQSVDVDEILVLDSGSTDGTQDMAQKYPKTRVIDIAPGTFNHGGTRNIGVKEATSDLVLMTVGDAWAYDDQWIQLMLDCLEPDIAAVCGMQCTAPEPDTNPIEWFSPISTPQAEVHQVESSNALREASQSELQRLAHWDDVTALYRRSTLLELPFPVTPYGEDIIWKFNALRHGLKLAYHPGARVFHHHLETPENLSKKTRAILALRFQTFGLLPVADSGSYRLRYLLRLLKNQKLSMKEKLYWYRYNLRNTAAIRQATFETREECLAGSTFPDLMNNLSSSPIGKGLAT